MSSTPKLPILLETSEPEDLQTRRTSSTTRSRPRKFRTHSSTTETHRPVGLGLTVNTSATFTGWIPRDAASATALATPARSRSGKSMRSTGSPKSVNRSPGSSDVSPGSGRHSPLLARKGGDRSSIYSTSTDVKDLEVYSGGGIAKDSKKVSPPTPIEGDRFFLVDEKTRLSTSGPPVGWFEGEDDQCTEFETGSDVGSDEDDTKVPTTARHSIMTSITKSHSPETPKEKEHSLARLTARLTTEPRSPAGNNTRQISFEADTWI